MVHRSGGSRWSVVRLCVLFPLLLAGLAACGGAEPPLSPPAPSPDGQPTPAESPLPASPDLVVGGRVHDAALPHAEEMAHAGMTWAATRVTYPQDVSDLVARWHGLGFQVLLTALAEPERVAQPGFEEDFAAWVATLAAAGVDGIEVWEEPNIERFWPAGRIDAQAYTDLLCASYREIEATNPGTAVILAAPAPTGYFGGCGAGGCDDRPWLQGLRDAGAGQCADFIGAHYRSGATPPSARSGHPADAGGRHHSWYFLPQTELYYDLFDRQLPLFYTAIGYASQEGVAPFSHLYDWAREVTNDQQAGWLAEAVTLSRKIDGVHGLVIYNVDLPRTALDVQDGYAILRPDGSCPACEALHAAGLEH